jgi:hypothetical protein
MISSVMENGAVSIDAVQLAKDLRKAYEEKVKAHVGELKPLAATMSKRLREMRKKYADQSALALPQLNLPPVKLPVGPPTSEKIYPSGQNFSNGPSGPAFPGITVYKSTP